MTLPCTIVSIRDKFYPPRERANALREIAAVTSRDPDEILDDASWVFADNGIQPDQCELQHEACITPEGEVLAVSSLGLYDETPHELDSLGRPRWRFSVAVTEKVRRKGIARALIESILRSHPREKYLLEGKVVNPHMAEFLKAKGFTYHFPDEYEDKEWGDLDLRIGRDMYLPNPGWWRAVHTYVSPRERPLTGQEAWVRDVAYGIKRGDRGAIEVAAAAMAQFVPEDSVIVPAPSSRSGSHGGVTALADRVADFSHGVSAILVSRTSDVPSSHERRRTGGRGLSVGEHLVSMKPEPGHEGRPIVLVDNVATSGATLEAMRSLLTDRSPDVRAVVWAEAREAT